MYVLVHLIGLKPLDSAIYGKYRSLGQGLQAYWIVYSLADSKGVLRLITERHINTTEFMVLSN